MSYKIYRRTAAVFIAFISAIMGAVLLFQQLLPDVYYVSESSELAFSSSYKNFISFDSREGDAKVVFGSNDDSYTASIEFFGAIPVKEVRVEVTDEKIVTVCGTPFGVKMFTDGVLIVGLSRIHTEDGLSCPALDSGIVEGDIICSIDGEKVYTNEDVASCIENSGGETLSMLIKRDGETMTVEVTPEKMADGSGYKAGFWVRDSSAGIGTLTFYDPKTKVFAGLGHAVCDVDTGEPLPLLSGEIVPAAINKIKRGAAGEPGELGGVFTSAKELGKVTVNNETGVYGVLNSDLDGISMPMAPKQDVYEGKATILATVNGTKAKEYDIIIEKVSLNDNSPTKNMVIKVVDEELLNEAGGIVQGMSGSPIIQNGRLVGAVTHVFVNDPAKGYGIFAENMLRASSGV